MGTELKQYGYFYTHWDEEPHSHTSNRNGPIHPQHHHSGNSRPPTQNQGHLDGPSHRQARFESRLMQLNAQCEPGDSSSYWLAAPCSKDAEWGAMMSTRTTPLTSYISGTDGSGYMLGSTFGSRDGITTHGTFWNHHYGS